MYERPINEAIAKLSNVPISIYSVNFLSFALDKSPNLNTDFAVKRKPIPSQCPEMMKRKTNKRSKMPIYLPASVSD